MGQQISKMVCNVPVRIIPILLVIEICPRCFANTSSHSRVSKVFGKRLVAGSYRGGILVFDILEVSNTHDAMHNNGHTILVLRVPRLNDTFCPQKVCVLLLLLFFAGCLQSWVIRNRGNMLFFNIASITFNAACFVVVVAHRQWHLHLAVGFCLDPPVPSLRLQLLWPTP